MEKFKERLVDMPISVLNLRKQILEDEIDRIRKNLEEEEERLRLVEEELAIKANAETINVLKISKKKNYGRSTDIVLVVYSVRKDELDKMIERLDNFKICWKDRGDLLKRIKEFDKKYDIKKIFTDSYNPSNEIKELYEVEDVSLNNILYLY